MNTSILLTSRERKNIDNEKVIDLEGLDTEEGKYYSSNLQTLNI